MDLDVLLPFHRFDDYLKQAIDSLAATKGVSFKTILIDDRIDKSRDINSLTYGLQSFEIISTNGGTGYGNALKIGSKHITANSVALFNSDDLIRPSRFKQQILELEKSELCITNISRIQWNNSKRSSITGGMKSKYYDPAYLLLGAYGADASWCMRTEWWQQHAFFDDQPCLDWRIALSTFSNTNISYIPEPLYFYRKHKYQLTHNKMMSKESLQPTFDLWNKLAKNYGLQTFSYDIFSIFAVPWNKTLNTQIVDIDVFIKEIMEYIEDKNYNLSNDFDRLLKRRLILAIRKDISFFDKLFLIKSGYTAILPIIKDMLLGII
jgi:hypothetical protein